MNVVIISEDAKYDKFIIIPLMDRLFASIGKKRVNIIIDDYPFGRGVSQVLTKPNLRRVIARFDYLQNVVYVLVVDRDGLDGKAGRKDRTARIAKLLVSLAMQNLFAAAAIEELETWLLAGIFTDLPAEWNWNDIRQEVSAKEVYFEPYAKSRGFGGTPDMGRKPLGEKASRNLAAIFVKCDEFKTLATQLKEHLS